MAIKPYCYLPSRYLEVVSFEIKPYATLDVSAVYEALSHRRASTHAYVLTHVPTSVHKESEEELKDTLAALENEANKFGIGIIVADDPNDFETWETLLDAERFEPNPARLNEFIAQQVSKASQDQIVCWFK